MELKTDLDSFSSEEQIIHHLSGETTRLISSTQIVTSVSSVVKELFENALDAKAQNILVKLENFGLDLIEIKDDGFGISYDNVQKMFLPGYTSKLHGYNDLDKLTTYGFRGEALGAICQLGNTSVTTKREEDALAMTYAITKSGEPSLSFPSHLPKGTIISVKNLFKDLPVRKQYASSKKKMTDELKKVENVVHSLSVIHPQLRVVLTHNKSTIWQKNAVKSMKQSFMQVVGLRHASKMDLLNKSRGNVTFDLILPKRDATDVDTLFSSTMTNSFVFVNCRPIISKEISKVIDELAREYWKIADKHVLFLFSLTVPPEEVDVNLEPNKTKVLLNNISEVLALLTECIQNYFGSVAQIPKWTEQLEMPNKKMKLDSSLLENENNCEITYSEEMSAVCSQINRQNCVLASDKEICDLNSKLMYNDNRIVTTPSVHIVREDIQQKVTSPDSIKLLNGVHNSTIPQNIVITTFQADFQKEADYVEQTNPTDQNIPVIKNVVPPFESVNKNDQSDISMDNSCIEKDVLSTNFQMTKGSWSRGQAILPNGTHLDSGVLLLTNKKHVASEESVVGKEPNELPVHTTSDVLSTKVQMTKDSWSRGQVVLPNGTQLDNGVLLLTNNKNFPREEIVAEKEPNELPVHTTSDMREDVSKFNLSLESVSSQMGKKELSAFTKFTRIMRPKIISENPNIMFTEVSRLLVERWKLLSGDEKEYYESVAKAVDEARKNHRQEKVEAVSNKNVQLPFKTPKRPDRRKTAMETSLEFIVYLRRAPKHPKDNHSHKLIGQLKDQPTWLYIRNKEIGGIRHTGLSELIMFHKMMSNLKIATRKLDNHEYLNPSNLGGENWNCLLSLDTKIEIDINRHVIISPVVDKNGFRIEIIPAEDRVSSTVILMEVALEIENYGINELKEALELYQQHGDFPALDELRPTAVRNHIISEVKRIVKTNVSTLDQEEMVAQLCTWRQSLQHFPAKCLHDKDIFSTIYQIQNNLP